VLQLVIVTIKQQVHSLIALKLLLLHSQSKQMPLQSEAYLWQMLIYFTTLLPLNSAINLQQLCYISHHICSVLLHYLVKYKISKTVENLTYLT